MFVKKSTKKIQIDADVYDDNNEFTDSLIDEELIQLLMAHLALSSTKVAPPPYF